MIMELRSTIPILSAEYRREPAETALPAAEFIERALKVTLVKVGPHVSVKKSSA